jgi:hypothetical protein
MAGTNFESKESIDDDGYHFHNAAPQQRQQKQTEETNDSSNKSRQSQTPLPGRYTSAGVVCIYNTLLYLHFVNHNGWRSSFFSGGHAKG